MDGVHAGSRRTAAVLWVLREGNAVLNSIPVLQRNLMSSFNLFLTGVHVCTCMHVPVCVSVYVCPCVRVHACNTLPRPISAHFPFQDVINRARLLTFIRE